MPGFAASNGGFTKLVQKSSTFWSEEVYQSIRPASAWARRGRTAEAGGGGAGGDEEFAAFHLSLPVERGARPSRFRSERSTLPR